jgi:hypothetical protein
MTYTILTDNVGIFAGDTSQTLDTYAPAFSAHHNVDQLMMVIVVQTATPSGFLSTMSLTSSEPWTLLGTTNYSTAVGKGRMSMWWRQAVSASYLTEPAVTVNVSPAADTNTNATGFASLLEFDAQLWPTNPVAQNLSSTGSFDYQASAYTATRTDTLFQNYSLGRPVTSITSAVQTANGWTSAAFAALNHQYRSQIDATPGSVTTPVYRHNFDSTAMSIICTLSSVPPVVAGMYTDGSFHMS